MNTHSFDDFLHAGLAEIDRGNLRRRLRRIDSAPGAIIATEGRELLNFSSNDYLGLANEPEIIEAARAATARWGAGSGSARLISGTLPPHLELEEAIAGFKRTEAALTFSCGYATALGTIPALAGKEDVIILDKLAHACLIDGARLSGATLRVFPHNDLDKLESHLKWAREKFPRARVYVITESVFSMDGDRAPLRDIVALKERFDAVLMVDEAHAVGVLGENGRGLVDALGLNGRVEIQMGTLGKALGASGGCIAGSRALIDFLINRARSFIFSTAPPPAAAAAASAALAFLQSRRGTQRLAALHHNLGLLAPGLPVPPESAIVPVLIGDEAQALELSKQMLDDGFLVPAVRYPTVARGKARLRITVSAAHSAAHVRRLAAWFPAPKKVSNFRNADISVGQ